MTENLKNLKSFEHTQLQVASTKCKILEVIESLENT